MPDTVAIPQRERIADTDLSRGWKVVLFNDDVTPFDVVLLGLQRAAGLSSEVAEMVASEAHREGHAVAKRGVREEVATRICKDLKRWTRVEGVCPGVRCEAEPDDP